MKIKYKIMPAILLVTLIVTFMITGSITSITQASGYQCGTYFPNWGVYSAAHQNMNVNMIPWDKVTFINHAFFEVNSSFQLASTDDWADFQMTFPHSDSYSVSPRLAGHFGEYRYYKSLYPNTKLLISIGGWTRGQNFHAMALSAGTRSIFIQGCINFLKTYPFVDGLDFDWEYPGVNRAPDPNDSYDKGCPGGPEDTVNFTSLLRELREAYNSNGLSNKLITIAGPGGYDKVDLQQPGIYHQYLDWINVMTYDIHGAWETNTNLQAALYPNPNDPSPTSPVDIKNKYCIDYIMKYYLSKGVPSHKINLGIPFYSRGWKNVGTNGINGLYATANGAPVGNLDNPTSPGGQNSYSQILTLESGGGFTKYRDSINNEPYLYNASQGIFYTYDDPASIGMKCDYARSNGFGGVFSWEISTDGTGFPLQNLLYTKMSGGQPTPPSGTPTPVTVTPTPVNPTPTPDSVYPEWNSTTVYTGGQRVTYHGYIYEAQWWTQGENPETSGSGVWKNLGPVDGSSTPTPTPTPVTVTPTPINPTPTPTPDSVYPEWNSTTVYTGGQRVTYHGYIYEAQWWTQGENPETSVSGVWRNLGSTDGNSTPTPTPIYVTPTPVNPTPTPGSGIVLSINGNVLSWTDSANGSDYHIYKNNNWLAWTGNRTYTINSASNGDAFYVTNGGGVKSNIVAYGNNSDPTPTPIVSPPPTTGTPVPPGSRMYVGYSSTWNTSIYDLMTANIPNYFTHLNLAFAKPNTTYVKGSYEFDQAVAGFEFVEGATTNNGQKKFSQQQAQDLRNNIAALKARGTQVWVSIGGWAYSQGSEWINFNAPRVVDLALDLGASGIDVDWEANGASVNKLGPDQFAGTKDGEIKGIITSLYNEIRSRGVNLGISIAGWSTGAYYVAGTPFEEGKVQWGSPFGGVMYRVVKDNGYMINFINLMSYDGGDYYDPREGYESYRAIYSGPINMGMEIAPEGAGGAVLKLNAEPGTVYDAEMLTGQNNMATKYYNVETLVNYIKNKGKSFDGFMIWQVWKERVYAPAPAGAATVNSAGQYVCRNLPLAGDPNQAIPNLPKLNP